MRAPDADALLNCWERGRTRHALDRALLLFATAMPGENADELADRSLGQRNAALLRLRQALFGDELRSCVDCSNCGDRLEFALSASALLAKPCSAATHVTLDGLRARLPTTRDLASIAHELDEAAAARKLLDRLVDPEHVALKPPCEVPIDRLNRALEEADPFIDFAMDLECPSCAHAWSAPFDVAAFLWEEIDTRSRRLFDEVHVLARTYGWTESEVLRLSEARRGAYLERALA